MICFGGARVMLDIPVENCEGFILDNDTVLLSVLGQGGMGTIYRARQLPLNREICLKFMRHGEARADEEKAVGRFRREAAALAKLRNSHIVEIYFIRLYNERYPYIGMELLAGQTMREALASGPLEYDRVCNIFIQLCDSIQHVHSHGFVHRDLKPDNIFLTTTTEGEFIKVLDFGLCGLREGMKAGATITGSGSVLGSVYYMAPECFRGPVSSPTVDIYSIGCMLYEALSGQPLFHGENVMALAYKHANESIPALGECVANERVRRSLNIIIKRACAKSVAERFGSCAEMSRDLRCVLDNADDVVETGSDSSNHKNRLLQAVMAAALAVGVLLLVPVTGSVSRAAWFLSARIALCLDNKGTNVQQDARKAYRVGEFDKAVELWRAYVSRGGDVPCDQLADARIELARASARCGDVDEAANSITEALAAIERDPGAIYLQSLAGVADVLHTAVRSRDELMLSARLTPSQVSSIHELICRVASRHASELLPDEVVIVLSELEFRQHRYIDAIKTLSLHRISDSVLHDTAIGKDNCNTGRFIDTCVALALKTADVAFKRRLIALMRLAQPSAPDSIVLVGLLGLMAQSDYHDNYSPSIWQVAQTRQRTSAIRSGSLKMPFDNYLRTLARQEACRTADLPSATAKYVKVTDDYTGAALIETWYKCDSIHKMIKDRKYDVADSALTELIRSQCVVAARGGEPLRFTELGDLMQELCAARCHDTDSLEKRKCDGMVIRWFELLRRQLQTDYGLQVLSVWSCTARNNHCARSIPVNLDVVTAVSRSDLRVDVRLATLCNLYAFIVASDFEAHEKRRMAANIVEAAIRVVLAAGRRLPSQEALHTAVLLELYARSSGLTHEGLALSGKLEAQVMQEASPQVQFMHQAFSFQLEVAEGAATSALNRGLLVTDMLNQQLKDTPANNQKAREFAAAAAGFPGRLRLLVTHRKMNQFIIAVDNEHKARMRRRRASPRASVDEEGDALQVSALIWQEALNAIRRRDVTAAISLSTISVSFYSLLDRK